MPELVVGQLRIPFQGRSPRSQRTSLQGAQIAIVRAQTQASRLLARYASHGPQTDLQLATALGLPESRISARRNGLIDRGFVTWVADVRGPYGAENGQYDLTETGRSVAAALR